MKNFLKYKIQKTDKIPKLKEIKYKNYMKKNMSSKNRITELKYISKLNHVD